MDSVLYFQRKNSGIHQLEITAVLVTSRALLHAGPRYPPPPPTLSLFPIIKSLFPASVFILIFFPSFHRCSSALLL